MDCLALLHHEVVLFIEDLQQKPPHQPQHLSLLILVPLKVLPCPCKSRMTREEFHPLRQLRQLQLQPRCVILPLNHTFKAELLDVVIVVEDLLHL